MNKTVSLLPRRKKLFIRRYLNPHRNMPFHKNRKKQLKFSTNAYGKPLLVNAPHMHFNISHAGHYVVCTVSDESVGIDIELIKPLDMKIAERFFTSDQTAYIMDDDHTRRFYEVWTKKECRIKWEGKGLHKPLASFSVFELNNREQAAYHKVFQNDETICHVCSKKQKPPTIRMMDTTLFIQNVRILQN